MVPSPGLAESWGLPTGTEPTWREAQPMKPLTDFCAMRRETRRLASFRRVRCSTRASTNCRSDGRSQPMGPGVLDVTDQEHEHSPGLRVVRRRREQGRCEAPSKNRGDGLHGRRYRPGKTWSTGRCRTSNCSWDRAPWIPRATLRSAEERRHLCPG